MSTRLSPKSVEMIERLVTERIESISAPMGGLHPDLKPIIEYRLALEGPTQKTIYGCSRSQLIEVIRGIVMGQ